MSIIHTSDWHLGKRIGPYSRLDEQELFLSWLSGYIRNNHIKALLISGDIFDTPNPPTRALKLYFHFLEEVTTQTDCNIFIISGNHDNGQFLEAPLPFLKKHRVFIAGVLDPNNISSHVISLNDKDIEITMMPFFRTKDLLEVSLQKESDNLTEEELTLKRLERWIELAKPKKEYSILMGHHNFGSFLGSDSEHSLSLSGIESLPLNYFKDWDYLALGHIHKPQTVKQSEPQAVYSGSPLSFRFSEIEQKTFCHIAISESNSFQIKKIPIPVFKPLIKLRLNTETYQEVLLDQLQSLEESAFFEITLELKKHQPKIIEWIKSKIHEKESQLVTFKPVFNETEKKLSLSRNDLQSYSLIDLFKRYQRYKFDSKDDEVIKNFNRFLEDYHQDNLKGTDQ